MQRLNQVLAAEKSAKTHAEKETTALYHTLEKPALFEGFSRTYQPNRDDGEKFPSETQVVQQRVDDVFSGIRRNMAAVWDITAAKDFANLTALADVAIGGTVILKGAPATFLLYVEKQLTDLYTVISKAPTLDPAVDWSQDPNTKLFKGEPQKTAKTKKVPKVITLAEATEHHPAQAQLVHDDEIVGWWTQTKASGALSQVRKRELLERIERLQKAVKFAREEANTTEAPEMKIGEIVLAYVFA
jgi:hypothetical protein